MFCQMCEVFVGDFLQELTGVLCEDCKTGMRNEIFARIELDE
tara:strand:- start:129 stop:254 length:126 start_codon:yes stop_codon:yes gene_type:complete